MSQSHIIGQWTCPSGNSVDAVLQGDGPDVTFMWDVIPLSPEDLAYYLRVIRPQAVMKALSQQPKKSIF
jgi:hypothetical protein